MIPELCIIAPGICVKQRGLTLLYAILSHTNLLWYGKGQFIFIAGFEDGFKIQQKNKKKVKEKFLSVVCANVGGEIT